MRGVLLFAAGAVIAFAIAVFNPALVIDLRERIAGSIPSASPSPAAQYANAAVVTDLREGGIRHFLGPRLSIRTKDYSIKHWGAGVSLELIVGESGRVLAARAIDGEKQFFAEAEKIGMQLQFVPFQRQGKPVIARIPRFPISIFPPERRPDYVTEFPEIKDWSSLHIVVQRSRGFGSLMYTLEVKGDGSIAFDGLNVAVPGKHRATIARDEVEKLIAVLRAKKLFWLHDKYASAASDQAWWTVDISFDGRSKKLWDYEGQEDGLPDAAKEMEYAIEAAVDVDRWLHGNAATVPSLIAEGWDFRARNDANASILVGVSSRAPISVLRELLALGLPIPPDSAALQIAAERGDMDVVQELLRPDVKWTALALGEALIESAGLQKDDVAVALLQAGANPGYQDDTWARQTPLIAAAEEGSIDVTALLLLWFSKGIYRPTADGTNGLYGKHWTPPKAASPQQMSRFLGAQDYNGETALHAASDGRVARPGESEAEIYARARTIAKMLLDAGANIEARDNMGQTPLMEVGIDAAMARFLLARGANVNARDNQGRTALMGCWSAELAKVLLEAGVDPNARDKDGKSALDHAQVSVPPEVAAVLRKWAAEHPGKQP